MQFHKNTAYSCFLIFTVILLLTPCPSYSFNTLDIFYSNDVGGQTEPCG